MCVCKKSFVKSLFCEKSARIAYEIYPTRATSSHGRALLRIGTKDFDRDGKDLMTN